ncbi:MAG: hypothetical protein AABX30_02275 [Nanoarchaeota archaeon]
MDEQIPYVEVTETRSLKTNRIIRTKKITAKTKESFEEVKDYLRTISRDCTEEKEKGFTYYIINQQKNCVGIAKDNDLSLLLTDSLDQETIDVLEEYAGGKLEER